MSTTIDQLADDDIVNQNELIFSGISVTGVTNNVNASYVRITLYDAGNNVVAQSNRASVTSGSWAAAFRPEDLAKLDGGHAYTAVATVYDASKTALESSNPSAFAVDATPPSLVSIALDDPAATAAHTVHYTVTFSDPVSGIDATDFSLATSGVSGASITGVTPVGGSNNTQYAVTVDTGTGKGTIRLDFTGAHGHDEAGNAFAGGIFGTLIASSIGITPPYIAFADLDGDGVLDLVATNWSGNAALVMLGNGDGTFATATSFTTDNMPNGVVLVDVNNDGKLDIVAGTSDRSVSVLLGNGDGTFQAHKDFPDTQLGGINAIVVGDFNEDGILDIADAHNANSGKIGIFIGTGTTSLFPSSPNRSLNVGVSGKPNTLVSADFNGDGHLDLVGTDQSTNKIFVLLGNGDGTFDTFTNVSLPSGASPDSIAIGDFNEDGKLDLVVSNVNTHNLSIFTGNGNGGFSRSDISLSGSAAIGLFVGDFNGDGHDDIAAALDSGAAILFGNGDRTFQIVRYALAAPGAALPISIIAGDFDGDGRPDLAVGDQDSKSVIVLPNQAATTEGAVYTIVTPAPAITSVTDDVGAQTGLLASGDVTDDTDLTVALSLAGTEAVVGDVVQLYDGTDTSHPLGSHTLDATDIANQSATVQTGLLSAGTTYALTARIEHADNSESDVSSSFTVTENSAPSALAASAEGDEDTMIIVTLSATDSEDGDTTAPTFALTGLPAHGSLYEFPPLPPFDPGVLANSGATHTADYFDGTAWVKTFYFVPDANWNGSDTVTYTATDSDGFTSAPADATIVVDAVADAPTVHAHAHDQPDPLDAAQQVTATGGSEDTPQAVALDGGGFVMVWVANFGQVVGQLFHDDGTTNGAQFAITPSGGAMELSPSVAALAGGGFVVTWAAIGGTGGDIQAAIYAAGATMPTTSFAVATDAASEARPHVTALDGGFVATWSVESGATATILAQRYDDSGTATGSVVTVTANAEHGFFSGASFFPPDHAITGLAGGGFVVSWSDGSATHETVVAVDGSIAGDVTAPGGSAIAAYGDGFIAAWADGELHAQIYDGAGQAVGSVLDLTDDPGADEQTPVIAVLPDGRFVVAWRGSNGTDGTTDIFAQVFFADGTPNNGGPLQVTATGDGSGSAISESLPTIAVLADGNIALGWLQPFSTGIQNDLYLRVYDPGIGTVAGTSDQPLALPTTVALGDQDGSEVLHQIRIEGLPSGFLVSDGVSVLGAREGGDPAGAWIIDASEGPDAAAFLASLLSGSGHLTLIPAQSYEGDFRLSVTATSEETQQPIAAGLQERGSSSVIVPVSFRMEHAPVALDDNANTSAAPLAADPVHPLVTLSGADSVLANDSDADTGETALLLVTAVGATAVAATGETAVTGTYGTLHIHADGTYFYVLDSDLAATRALAGGEQRTEQFVYTAANHGGGAGNEANATLSIVIAGANDAPTDMALSHAVVPENSSGGTVVGSLSDTDPDTGDSAAFTLLDDAGGRFAISGDTLVVANGALLDFEQNTSHSVTVRVTDSGGLTFDKAFTIAIADVDDTAAPFSSSFQWQHSVSLGAHATNWEIAGIGDFNGDGTDDILWHNPTTGRLDEWQMRDGNWSASIDPGTHGSAWTIAGVGDFNGDGTDDVLWHDTATGRLDAWIMANGQWSRSVDLGSHGADWKVLGIGDFNGDGTSDVMFQNTTSGAVDEWLMSDGNWSSSQSLGTHDIAWSTAAVGDFDGDGTSDVLWQNPLTGAVEEWHMQNGDWAGSVSLGSHETAYRLAAVNDFNGDGTDDVFWHDPSTGQVDGWVMHATQWLASVSLGAFNTAYQVAGAGDFDHAGGADVAWHNPATGQTETWLLA
jgi:VCBS repeat-containing protein